MPDAKKETSKPETKSKDCRQWGIFDVAVAANRNETSVQDERAHQAAALAARLRRRPTLPANPRNPEEPWDDVSSGHRWPRVACAFKNCLAQFSSYDQLYLHLIQPQSNLREGGHLEVLHECIGESNVKDAASFYAEAIAWHERQGVPSVGYSVDRRSIDLTTALYNDSQIMALMCFICAQVKPQTASVNSLIGYRSGVWLLGDPY